MPSGESGSNLPFVVATVAFIVVGAWVWYAWGLARVFDSLELPRRKAWVPVLGDIEIMRVGGAQGWQIVTVFIPIVNAYAIYLRIIGTHIINARFRRGTGMTVLATIAPPVWATILASAGRPAYEAGERIAVAAERASQQVARSRSVAELMEEVESMDDKAPEDENEEETENDAATPPSGLSLPAPPRPMPSPSPITEESREKVAPVVIHNPWAEPATERSPDDDDGASDDRAPAPLPPPPVSIHLPAPANAGQFEPSLGPAPSAELDEDEDDEDEFDHTVMVDRRPKVQWVLNVDGMDPFMLTGTSVLLGRKPTAAIGVQALTVPDATKTLSKVHARLDLHDDEWTITDLNSMNGVLIIEPDGNERLLVPGTSATVSGRFILGEVGMSISFETPDR